MQQLTEHRTRITGVLLTTTPDHSLGIVLSMPNSRQFARADVSGEWMTSLVDALGCGVVAFFGGPVDYACRVRLDIATNQVAEIGHITFDDYWFEVLPSPSPGPVVGLAPTPVDRALRYLNKQRALRGRRDLDPSAGFTDDDIIADALFYGWKG